MNPFISVCIPVYNGASFLRECLESVIGQTYSNFEIIIIDDNSSDNSVALIEEYLYRHPKISFFKNEDNLGLTSNWNSCISKSNGEWVKFIFQDDYLEKNCLEEFVRYSQMHNSCPLIVSKRKFLIDDSLSEQEKQYYTKALPTLSNLNLKTTDHFISVFDISNAAARNIALNFIGEPTVYMFKKSVTDKVGFFNEKLDQICDLEFVLRIGTNYGLIYIPEELTNFRIHPDSATNKNLSEKYYRLRYLEPIKLVHLLLFSGAYNSFRNYLSLFNKSKLRLYFYVRAMEAFRLTKNSLSRLEEYNSAAISFPEISGNHYNPFNFILIFFLRIKRYFRNSF